MSGFAIQREALMFVCLVSACAAEPRSDVGSPTNALLDDASLTPRTWQAEALIPGFAAPVTATLGDTLVLVGNGGVSSDPVDIWRFDGATWGLRRSGPGPQYAGTPGLARVDNQLVLFGGVGPVGGSEYSDQTYTTGGWSWSYVLPKPGPSPRTQPSFASFGNYALLFGGQDATGSLNDTWRRDANGWTQLSAAGPSYCNSPLAAVDCNGLMFCAALDPEDHFGHTWEWDGTRWSERHPRTQPSNRYGHVLAGYGDHALMYGGWADSGELQETWEWDGEDWHDRTTSPSPPPREGYQLAQLGDQLVLHGGGSTQTWGWDGAGWSTLTEKSMPETRRGYAIATLGERVILFGGCCRNGPLDSEPSWNDTWEWNGSRWTELHPQTQPPGRSGAALAALGGKLVLFGGSSISEVFDDTWEFDGESWSERKPALSPEARQHHALAAYKGKVILFGGTHSTVLQPEAALADAWQWDGTTWTQLPTAAGIPASYRASMANFEGELMLSTGSFTRMWAWDGSTWSQRQLADVEPATEGLTHLVEVGQGAAGTRLVAAGSTNDVFITREWDGSAWNDQTSVERLEPGQVARLSTTLVGLDGTPSRTWVYAGR